MGKIMNGLLGNLWNDDSGQDLAEYALLFALIAIVAISSLYIIGGGLNDVFTGVGNELESGFAGT
jgi:pilus assembly protein Flp/PilA